MPTFVRNDQAYEVSWRIGILLDPRLCIPGILAGCVLEHRRYMFSFSVYGASL